MALNCALTARIIASGLFRDVFVQPASHDAGGALGAALFVSAHEDALPVRPERLENLYWGTDVGTSEQILPALQRWSRFLRWERIEDITTRAAQCLAGGAVIGWVQGRSEFGPRALGNRSILADPRHSQTRDLVNQMIKRREEFRPFAPSVLEELSSKYFKMPTSCSSLPFMLVLVQVLRDRQDVLGAVAHVDGTARIQTVRRESNPRYWELINKFGAITGVYALLNTSFNNSAEPIVDSVEDSLVAFLTTGLHHLVVGDFFVTRHTDSDDLILDSAFSIAPCAECGLSYKGAGRLIGWVKYRYESPLAQRDSTTIAASTFEVLSKVDGRTTLRRIIDRTGSWNDAGEVIKELRQLWWLRLVQLQPDPEPLWSIEQNASVG